jgi:predicted nucleic acid-binding protein
MNALFDTNVLIDYLKGIEEARKEIERNPVRLISTVTRMDVLVGGRTEEETDVLEMFLRDFRTVDITRRVAREAIEVRKGRHICLPDAIIWASARVESALLVTRNSKDFPAAEPGVRIPY